MSFLMLLAAVKVPYVYCSLLQPQAKREHVALSPSVTTLAVPKANHPGSLSNGHH